MGIEIESQYERVCSCPPPLVGAVRVEPDYHLPTTFADQITVRPHSFKRLVAFELGKRLRLDISPATARELADHLVDFADRVELRQGV